MLQKYGLVASSAFVVLWRAIDTIVSMHVENGPEAVPGVICRSALSKDSSVSFKYCAAGGPIVD